MFGNILKPGQFVSFTYNPPVRPVRQRAGMASVKSDPHKQVLILHPSWVGKAHAIDLKRVTPAEVQVLKSIMDPEAKAEFDRTGQLPQGIPHYPLIIDVFRRMNPPEDIKQPISFYQKFVRPFIRDKDCYRTFFPAFISGITVLRESEVRGAVVNPRPLFHK